MAKNINLLNSYPSPARLSNCRRRDAVLVSIAVPALNERDNLEVLYERIRNVMDDQRADFELVIADNGSSDDSLQVLAKLARRDPRVRPLALSRNFGHQGGLIAALEHCDGDLVICMDADLQHPPETLPDLLHAWEQGYDVVNTRKTAKHGDSIIRGLSDRLYYWLVSRTSGIPMYDRQSDFRLMDRRALDALMALPEKNKYLRGLSYWIGFAHQTVEYVASSRHAGKSRYLFRDLMRFATDGLISFSILPLRLFTFAGLLISSGALAYGSYSALEWLLGEAVSAPPGWASLAVGVYVLGGINLIGIGLLGEYLGRTYDETRDRPSYILRKAPPPARRRAPGTATASDRAGTSTER